METKVLTQDELQLLKNIQESKNQLISEFGIIEYQIQDLNNQKNILINTLSQIKTKEIEISKELQAKYGDGNINLTTGEFTSIT